MPRRLRYAPPAGVLHVVNRGNERRALFTESRDFEAFLGLMSWAKERCPINILGYCLMPNHWHLVLSPGNAGSLSRYLHRVCTTHAVRLRWATGSVGNGHVYQQRYHASLVDSERYYFHVLRYVEANALRAGLVERAEDWAWSSLAERCGEDRGILSPPPLPLPHDWVEIVNEGLPADILGEIRSSTLAHNPTIR